MLFRSALVFKQAIAQISYERQRDRLRQETALAEIELHDSKLEELDVETATDFAMHFLSNAGRIWIEATPTQKLRFQDAVFPEGVTFDGREVGTERTCLAFSYLQDIQDEESGMVGPPGFEPGTSRL